MNLRRMLKKHDEDLQFLVDLLHANASILTALAGMAVDVISLFMALLPPVELKSRAYELKASNAAPPIFNDGRKREPVVVISGNICDD